MRACLIRLAGVTAHFRDPRLNTAKIDLPARTLRCPPPCTIHGLLCAAKGGWVPPNTLQIGWRTEYASMAADLQMSRLPQRETKGARKGTQKGVKTSPIEREILAFPLLSLLGLDGIDPEWFRRPANPLSLGRSEDLIISTHTESVEVELASTATIRSQCLPFGIASGTIYATPLYFRNNRIPVGMGPKIDVVSWQTVVGATGRPAFAIVHNTGEAFYLWRFGESES